MREEIKELMRGHLVPKVSAEERREAEKKKVLSVRKGLKKFGWGFFMVDQSGVRRYSAAPFCIESKEDMKLFITEASPFVNWDAQLHPNWREEADKKEEVVYRELE